MASATTQDDGRERAGIGAVLRLPVELWLVVVMMALAFGAGIVVTALYDEPQVQPVIGTQLPAGQVTLAPPLTDEQISQGLPSGHPDIAGETGSKADEGQRGPDGDDAARGAGSEGTG